MKRSGLFCLSLLLSLSFLPIPAFAAANTQSQAYEIRLSSTERALIQPQSSQLVLNKTACQSSDCQQLKQDPGRAALLNIIPFGVGSYQQGDLIGGAALSTLDGLSTLSILAALLLPSLSSGGGWGAFFVVTWGLGGLILGRLLGWVLPFIYDSVHTPTASLPADRTGQQAAEWVHYQLSF